MSMSEFNTVFLLVVGLFAATGVWLFITGVYRLLRGRLLRGPLRAAFGAAFGAIAVALAAIAMNIHTYRQLNYEQPVAWLEFQQVAPRQFQALLRMADGNERAFGVHGEEWQLDARVLKWKGIGALLGLEPRYRLERFGGRYATAADENRARRSIYGLHEGERGVDVWALSRRHERLLPLVDTVYGSSTYMPMHDGARYVVVITEDGLVARAERTQSSSRSQ